MPSLMLDSLVWPADAALGVTVRWLERIGRLSKLSDAAYNTVRMALRAQLRGINDLDVQGEDNLPAGGGVILASNHQSWLDVSAIIAASPRRVHFVAKAEFASWRIMRHLVRLSESLFVRRGGDDSGLQNIADALRRGWAMGIFPEGTIPGEEDIPRHLVDPRTGLLRGRTGAVRLALRAGVPIVPIGISGTGRALPPEVYPRLELLRMPQPTPVTVRFGEPIYYDQHGTGTLSREVYRELTDELMLAISELVDHRANYAPLQVPVAEPHRSLSLGVLALHDFASSPAALFPLLERLSSQGIPFAAPTFSGHGTRPQDMIGVTSRDWFVDARAALVSLLETSEHVVVVGFGMGALVGLELAARHPDLCAGVCSVGAPFKLKDPRARFASTAAEAAKYTHTPAGLMAEERPPKLKGYTRFPTATFAELYEYIQESLDNASLVHTPLRIIQAKDDRIVVPVSANVLYETVRSVRRELVWLEKGGHDLLGGPSEATALEAVMEFISEFRSIGTESVAPVPH
ncbi:MAG: alpha/beta fold hydrolase [Myxococcota bacterium]|jgi:1-acyl-sn-glycerol-3-phosphate acyltransferase|nr:alpha/beta fold hydrolase [Myxococcota bacterium]